MIVLPGLFDFVTGTNSAIQQNQGRLLNQNQVTSNFVNSLNAFNLAQNTDDNLQLRNLFQQSEGPTLLDRLDDVFANANNPFTAQQALIASQQAAPLLAQRTLQNPFLNQGITGGLQQQLSQGFFGVNPILQQQANQRTLDIFGQTGNLNLGALQRGLGLSQPLQQGLTSARNAIDTQRLADQQRVIEDLQEQLRRRAAPQATTVPQPSTSLSLPSSTQRAAPASSTQAIGRTTGIQ